MTIHLEDKGRHVEELDQRIRALQAGFADPATSDDFDTLLRIIHRPGYTSVAHMIFVTR